MIADRTSFLAGVIAGQRLKSWAAGRALVQPQNQQDQNSQQGQQDQGGSSQQGSSQGG